MVYINMRVHHGGAFGYEEGVFKYLKGQSTIIEVIDSDRWSVFEAYEELRQFGYLQANIVALWYKDPSLDDLETSLKMLKGDAEATEMCNIAGLRGLVELYVVHDVGDAEPFPEVGYVDVGGVAEEGTDDGLGLVVFEEHGAEAAEFRVDGSDSNDEDSEDPKYMPSDEEGDSAGDVHFTYNNGDYEGDSEFDEDNSMPKKATAGKEKGSGINQFSDEDGADSDELEIDHMIGGDEGDDEDAENDADDDCPFRLYAHRVGDESTWQLRSLNLQHTCMQTHRVGILHTKWLGAQFKKKVESNPRIKIRELQAKAHKKWNVTVTKSMVAKSKQEALSQIQGAFREQYRRINDYCAELLRANPDLAAGECSCRRWQMSRLPCSHAISCITFKGLDLESFMDDHYKKDAYLRCYQKVIHPLNGPDLWQRSQYDYVMPPPYRRPSHRLVKKRKRGPEDEDNRSQTHLFRRGQTQRCSNYGALGHKKSSCTKPNKKVQPASQQASKGPKRGTKVASSQPPGQTVQRGKLSKKSCSQPSPATTHSNTATTHSNTATTQPKKPVIRLRKLVARPTDHSTQPKNQTKNEAGPAPPQSNPKSPSSQPLPKSSAAASSTSKKDSHSQPTERKWCFFVI
ncbi:hypothetical protein Ahy_B09g098497 [Arachis hypogaea]|uniref:SWIM-type domain-containing protein n=1 Tax=Arachis hypogaea TaxID=3818 RepID=A0A444XS14_ARAHY|nr:hypothetical protein Ahy_B09g098497 [Arachis hypogaea]